MIATLLLAACCAPQHAEDPVKIELQAVIETAPATLYRMFTSSEGVEQIFPGATAAIDARVGGEYRVAFAPDSDPEGTGPGTAGCRILELVPDRRLVVQWNGPPAFPILRQDPLPTRVEIDLSPVAAAGAEDGSHTALTLRHLGFGSGAEWQGGYEFLLSSWKTTVELLQLRFAAQPTFATGPELEHPAQLLIARMPHGPAWEEDRRSFEQDRFMNHAAYVLHALARGALFMAGPLENETAGFVIFPHGDRVTATKFLEADPAVQAGVLRFELHEWSPTLPSAAKLEQLRSGQ